jgi:hypothetical protein
MEGLVDDLAERGLDDNRSGADFSLAAMLNAAGFTRPEIAMIFCAFPHGKANGDDRSDAAARLRQAARNALRSHDPQIRSVIRPVIRVVAGEPHIAATAGEAATIAVRKPIYQRGNSGGDTLNLTGQTQTATINLDGNTASASAGLSAPALTFIGTPDAIILGSAAATIQYALEPSSDIETIANFVYGLDLLNIDLLGAAPGMLQTYDTTVNGQHAIAIASSADPLLGVVLLNMPTTDAAANLLTNHTTFSGSHAVIS